MARKWTLILGGTAAVCEAVAISWFGYRILTWPDVAALATSNPATSGFIERYKAEMRRHGKSGRLEWEWVPYQQISPELKVAVVVSEDINFFSHHGFDAGEIHSALRHAWQEKELPRGASTITQQVAKNLWLSPSYNPLRKLEEALLTRQLERRLSKRRILEIYLNVVQFGPGVYGAEAAAQHFFAEPAGELSSRQAAELAAGLSRPSLWHPGVSRRGYLRDVERLESAIGQASWLRKAI